jgi:hypothetical protein
LWVGLPVQMFLFRGMGVAGWTVLPVQIFVDRRMGMKHDVRNMRWGFI